MVSLEISNLYSTYYKRLLHLSYSITKDRHLAEDVVQETFIKVMNHLDTVQDVNKLPAWLCVITKRTAIDILRTKQNDLPMEQDLLMNSVNDMNQTVEEIVEFTLFIKEVEEKIRSLNCIYYDVMMLKIQHELREQEIANQLNIKLSSVKTRIHRARKYLLKEFRDQVSA
ncbi:RNA polymerase sigma factor [Ornithinibacillus californiensis]|uniref:RNA polymerase sigma factor n=1 Tax=Ornithinibacillus californiensis TaxID=161536 RepID=UPI00064DC6DC|nr:sigma-70 family RNA polymerase sigma factor [Ornithinibacillus californiensis]